MNYTVVFTVTIADPPSSVACCGGGGGKGFDVDRILSNQTLIPSTVENRGILFKTVLTSLLYFYI